MDTDVILVIVVATALAFDFTNGFHDTANAVATAVSTRAMAPTAAVAHRRGPELRRRVHLARGRRDDRQRHRRGGRDQRDDRLRRPHRGDRLEPHHVVLRPAVELVARADRRRGGRGVRRGGAGRRARRRADREGRSSPRSSRPSSRSSPPAWRSCIAYRIVGRLRPGPGQPRLPPRADRLRRRCSRWPTARTTRRRRWASSRWRSSRTATSRPGADPPFWVVVSAATAIALGTYSGGWRIMKTMGSRIIKMDPAQGFSAQGGGAAVILTATHLGFPLSTTHTISGARHGRGRGAAALGGAVGRRGEHRRSPGC